MTRWLLVALGLAAVGLLAYSVALRMSAQMQLAELQTAVAQSAVAAQLAARDQELTWAERLKETQHVLEKERRAAAVTAGALRSARVELGGLREQLAAYATGTPAPDDSVAACRHRAETLGALLGEGLRIQEELAADGESCESSLRAVLNAWPRQQISDAGQ